MLIRLNGEDAIACENGLLRGDAVQMVLGADEARALLRERAETMLSRARDEAAAIVEQAQRQAGEIVAQAEAQAIAAVAEAQARIEAAAQQVRDEAARNAATEWHDRHADQLVRTARMLDGLNERLAGIVTTAAERVVLAQPRSALFQRALRHVQGLTRGATTLSVRVHPDDEEEARAALAPLRDNGTLAVEVLPEPGLAPGACRFESEFGVLDAGLQTQLEALRSAMSRALAAVAPADAPTPAGQAQPAPAAEQAAAADAPGHDGAAAQRNPLHRAEPARFGGHDDFDDDEDYDEYDAYDHANDDSVDFEGERPPRDNGGPEGYDEDDEHDHWGEDEE